LSRNEPTAGLSSSTDNSSAVIKSNDNNVNNNSTNNGSDNVGVEDTSDELASMGILQSNVHSWLVEEATLGDEDAQYALARFFTIPPFAENSQCAICCRGFNITLFRHHCRFCGRSVCNDHSQGMYAVWCFSVYMCRIFLYMCITYIYASGLLFYVHFSPPPMFVCALLLMYAYLLVPYVL
jgi:hypothetical protein